MKRPYWVDKLQAYAVPNSFKSLTYIATSVLPYLMIMAAMLYLMTAGFPYWIILILSVFAVGFFIRTFMILHDCSHSSFVSSKIVSYILGHICGVITMTPFFDWQRNHGIHHASVGNLEKRGTGDVWTMTVNEYNQLSAPLRFRYRFFRNPAFLFSIAPILLFCVMYRFPQQSTRRKDYFSIVITDIILALIMITAYKTIGLKNYLAVQLPIMAVATSIGMWLFYIQHQFKTVYWAHHDNWDLISAATKGSSFYKLPEVLRWFTGNIGYHNIHHLKPRIPSYHLKNCYDNVPELHETIPITFFSGFTSLRLHLWDEKIENLVSFADADKKRHVYGSSQSRS